jgi:hypothetical protein
MNRDTKPLGLPSLVGDLFTRSESLMGAISKILFHFELRNS